MNATANFLAVDLGASGGRVLLGRWDGARFALAELHRFANRPVHVLGEWRWDVLQLWSEIKAGLAAYRVAADTALAGIAVDTWGVDFGLFDRAGKLLGNPFCYRDARTAGVEPRLFQRAPRNEIFALTGIQFMRINTLYQLFSMIGDPQLEAAETLLMMPDLFHYWMTGRKVAEYTQASTSQCFHARERRWANELLDRLDLPSRILPEVVFPGTVIGELRGDITAELRLPERTPVIAPGSHDTASAVVAVPGLDQHSAYISSGTWSLVGVETAEPIITERSLALNFTNEGGVSGTIRLLKNVMGLWLIQECRAQWQREGQGYGWDELLALADQAPPFRSLIDPDAAEFLEPGDMPNAIRDFCRRTQQPIPESAGAVVRCCLESLALRYRWVLLALEELLGRPLRTIRVVGGGSRNRLLCQFTADACGRPVIAGPVEATALGNILIQAIAAGHLADLTSARQALAASVDLKQYDPRPAAAWDEAFDRFSALIAMPAND
jgi:rhamnulokinase